MRSETGSARRVPVSRFRRRIRRDKLRGVSILVLTYVMLKVSAMLLLGPGVYAVKVDKIASAGTFPERVIAWAMTPDAATVKLAHVLVNFGP
ncbi:hypothetical protein EU805_15405 [Salipiger sp. IMCC34102]|uniref:hypothetical protein n=1 Tax=Salipiger sp. IMCC34102 TaxID=2510647 RepID=UPI00101DEF5A|nr:hypothetical protein [Salipiger sp. IMCC34102]RYH01161.1 hypothetical protein EU805_15405 [Salipiger sp. IMCC34102]